MLKPVIGFRAATHADAGFAAATSTAAEPKHPQVAEELLEKWTKSEAGSAVRRFIVQESALRISASIRRMSCSGPWRISEARRSFDASTPYRLPTSR